MTNRSLTIKQILALLAEAPQQLEALTASLSAGELHNSPNQDEWSANDVLAHVRACADVWGNCILEIINRDKPTLRAINPRTRINRTNYPQQNFRASLRAFTAQRADLLATLEPLPRRNWSRTAMVTRAGKPLQRTVLFYAEWLATHERTRIKQIQRIVNSRNDS